jgi:hypothetical protein
MCSFPSYTEIDKSMNRFPKKIPYQEFESSLAKNVKYCYMAEIYGFSGIVFDFPVEQRKDIGNGWYKVTWPSHLFG